MLRSDPRVTGPVLTLVAAGILAAGCRPPGKASPPAPPRFRFHNVAAAAGLVFRHRNGPARPLDILRTTGSGLAWLDYDRDGWPDLFCVNDAPPDAAADPTAGHRLYRNRHDGTFEDVTERAGLRGLGQAGMGVAVGDLEGDGWPDLYVACFGKNHLYRNEQGGTFRDITETVGGGGSADRWNAAAAWFDAEGDGDLDLYVTGYCAYGAAAPRFCTLGGVKTACPPTHYSGERDLFFRNEGGKRLVSDPTYFPLKDRPPGRGLGVLPFDADGDGTPEVFVANDGGGNFFFRRERGAYVEGAYSTGLALDANGADPAGMGVDVADEDGNGLPDLLLANFQDAPNLLYRQESSGSFREVSGNVGLAMPTRRVLTFGAGFEDFDLDGRLEILFVNGHVQDNIDRIQTGVMWAQHPQLFTSAGGSYQDVSASSGSAFQEPLVGRGAAFADYDRDGDVDVAVSVNGGPVELWQNESTRGHWLQLELQGKAPNLQSIGARVTLRAGGTSRTRDVLTGRSYFSDSERVLTFGLGSVTALESLEVRWPDGTRQTVPAPAVDRRVVVKQERP